MFRLFFNDYYIRQEIYQCVPSNLNGNAKFGPFLITTRREILDRLLQIQKHLSIELITPIEYNYIQELINKDSENQTQQGLNEFVFELSNDSKIATVSDFNIAQTSRKRLGSISLKRMKLIKINSASSEYSKLTRVIYYSI